MVIMTDKTSRNMQVVLRVRPLNAHEMEQNQKKIIHEADETTIIFDPDESEDEFYFHGAKQTHRDITKRINKNLPMTFNRIFGNASTNQEIFEHSMRPLVSAVLDGYNCSAFVYGATGAGKTFTMLGNGEVPGVTFLTMQELFNQIEVLSAERQFDIGISYLEVYNEQVMNLLTKSGPLKLREDSNGVVIGGLQLKPIHCADELLSLLTFGNQNRTQHPTDANAESSRSHAIFQVHIRITMKTTGVKRLAKLSMIDLAGSERGSSTKCVGQRFKEGASINKSLLALGNCINKLADGCKHIPYRDSNMTRILKDSLGGNCKTVMIANVSPSSLTFEDTYNTLKYATRAQKIRSVTLTKNAMKSNLPAEYYIRKLTDLTNENEQLKKRIKLMESKHQEPEKKRNSQAVNFEELMVESEKWERRINPIYDLMKTEQECYFAQYSKQQVLKFRMKLKEATEKAKQDFNINGSGLDRELVKIRASVDQFNKQIETYEIEKQKWVARFQEASNDLFKLKRELANKPIEPFVQKYLLTKQMQLENLQANLKSEHVNKINQMMYNELEHMRVIQQQSNQLLQQDYLLLNANMMMTNAMELSHQELYKSFDVQRSVTFSTENKIKYDYDVEQMILPTNGHQEHMDCDVVAMKNTDGRSIVSGPKAKRALHTLTSTSELDVTQVLERHDDDVKMNDLELLSGAHNFTFAINSKPSHMTIGKRPAMTSRVLKDTQQNIHRDTVITKGFAKPMTTMSRAPLKEKENKRMAAITPVRVRKSPRRIGSPSATLNKVMNVNRGRPKTPEQVALKRLKTSARKIITKQLHK